MSNEVKYCGYCGIANPSENKFCNRCGHPFPVIVQERERSLKSNEDFKLPAKRITASKSKLIQTSTQSRPIEKVESEYKILQEKLTKLNSTGGILRVLCGDNFIRFTRKKGSHRLIIDLGTFEDEEDTVIKIKALGYTEANGTLQKEFPIGVLGEVIFKAVEETKILFETIFNVPRPINLAYEEEFDAAPVVKNKPFKNNRTKINNEPEQKPATTLQGCITLVVIGIIILIAIGYCNSSSNPAQTGESKIDLEAENMKTNAFIYSKRYVKEGLKQPHTADFPTLDFSCSVILADSTYWVTSYVDAQNAFGASIRNKYVAVMKYKGGEPNEESSWALNSMEFLPE